MYKENVAYARFPGERRLLILAQNPKLDQRSFNASEVCFATYATSNRNKFLEKAMIFENKPGPIMI